MDDQASGGVAGDETLEEILDQLTGGLTSLQDEHEQGYQGIMTRLDAIASDVSELNEQSAGGSATRSESDTVTVVMDATQFDVIRQGIGVICTESFILVSLLALACGLQGFKLFSGGWRA